MLAMFGFLLALAYQAPWFVWAVGALCLALDVIWRRRAMSLAQ